MTDNLELKGTVCPICGCEFKFGTPHCRADKPDIECVVKWSEERGE